MTNEVRALARAIGGSTDAADLDALVDAAIAHGVAALLAGAPAAASMLSPAARNRLLEHMRVDALRGAVFDAELGRVLGAAAADAVPVLVFKGAHLAHAVYRRPAMRPRADTDLLIDVVDRDRMAAVLARCGYAPAAHVRGRLILGQFHFEKTDASGIAHYYDVHWRAAAPLVVERALPSALFFRSATPLPAQGSNARAPALPHALLLACVHLAAHHRVRPRLLWLYDVGRLVEAHDAPQRAAFLNLASQTRCRAIAAHAIGSAAGVFPSESLTELASVLRRFPAADEPTAALLRVRRPAGALWLDVRAAGWRDGMRLLGEHLLPDRAYMAHAGGGAPAPLAYAARAARGVRRWIAVSAADRTAERGE
ncbi:MAG TPA: nucleotidyltransferase family protein [Vicinamibacterales bacterium]